MTVKTAYFDSSVLVRNYLVNEPWAAQAIEALHRPGQRNAISQAGRVETVRALSAAARNARLTQLQRDQILLSLSEKLDGEFSVTDISLGICEAAVTLVRDHPVRSLDALHIATALVLSTLMDGDDTLVFVTADGRQAEAAEAVGLAVEFIGEPSAATDPQS